MSNKLKLIETLATFGQPSKNSIGETCVVVKIPSSVRSQTRFCDTVSDRIDGQLEEQEIPYRSNGGMITDDEDGNPVAELDFKSILRR
jgi:hypothetical protein